MKNRIKTFYQDHKNEIVTAAITAALTATLVSLQAAEANKVVQVKASRTTDGAVHVFVFQKNGTKNRFDGMPKEIK